MTLMYHCAIVSGLEVHLVLDQCCFNKLLHRDDIAREMTNRVYNFDIHTCVYLFRTFKGIIKLYTVLHAE